MSGVSIFGCVGEWPRPIPPGEVWYPNFRPPPPILKRLTRSFQMHPWAVMVRSERKWLRECPVPIYTVEDLDRYNVQAKVYDLYRWAKDPWTSSFDYMVALALSEKLDPIRLYGIGLQMGSLRERLCEHVGLAYWIGRARGEGLDVLIDRGCWILSYPYDYGFDYWDERKWCQNLGRQARRLKVLDDGQARPDRTVKGVSFSGRA